jgi:DNA-binding response OmpR family regulator
MNILVVEDEIQIAELIRRELQEMGNQCILARDAEHADNLLDEHLVDGVTLDLGMPGRGGLDWLEAMALFDPALARRTLVITGLDADREVMERLVQCGAGFLAKPFTMEALRHAIDSQLRGGAAHN